LCHVDNFWGVEFLHRSYQKLRRAYINYIEIIVETMANANRVISARRRRISAYDSAIER